MRAARANDPTTEVSSMRSVSIPAVALATALALGAATPAAAESAHDLEALVIELATTPAQHKAVAEHYRAEAADARKQAERHRSMGKSYGAGKFVQRQEMQKHCDALAADYEAQAKQYDELAQLHEREAGAE